MLKLYCYVDESGQDTRGEFFAVSVVVTEADHEQLLDALTRVEQETLKGRRKWSKSKPERRYAYLHRVLREPRIRHALYYGVFRNTTAYVEATVEIAARAIARRAPPEYKASVFVDGLSRPDERRFAHSLRRYGIRTEKVRGVRDEAANAFIRLADAACGFLREALYEGDEELSRLLERALKYHWLEDLRGGE